MNVVKIINQTNEQVLGDKITYANSIYGRFIGLMGKSELKKGEGVFLTPCNSIHMMFMKFPLDILFLDRKNKIIHITKDIKPWKISRVVFKAQSVLEVPAGTVENTKSNVGDIIKIEF